MKALTVERSDPIIRAVEFDGFIAEDFAAYQQHKWQSNAFNLERLQVKEKLSALGRCLSPRLLASDNSLLELELSAEHPALWNHRCVDTQHLFFSRNSIARKELDGIISRSRTMASLIEDPSPLRNHIFLSVRIDADSLELALKLHSDAAVDRDNLQRKTQDFFHREKLLGLLTTLPEGFEVGLASADLVACSALDDEKLQALIADLPTADSWLVARRLFVADEAIAASASFVETAQEVFGQLLPLLHYASWSRDNDFLSMSATLREKEVKQKSKGLAKNDRVRVVNGIFSGKTGVVEAVDAKGVLKVRLGNMSVKLDGEDVTKA